MGIPGNAAAQEEKDVQSTFADAVIKVVNEAQVDDKGNLVLPDNLSEEVKFAATLEKRRRDTQSSYSKLTNTLKAKEAENALLITEVVNDAVLELTQEQNDELEELKFSDPEAWRKKVNAYEADAKKKRSTSINERVKQVAAQTLGAEEIERRKEVLVEFLGANPGFNLDDDVIANDIPPRITRKLEKGDITFEQYLQECLDYTKTGKVIKQEKTMDQPDLNKVGGGNKPSDNAVKEDIVKSYEKETY